MVFLRPTRDVWTLTTQQSRATWWLRAPRVARCASSLSRVETASFSTLIARDCLSPATGGDELLVLGL